MFWMREDSPVGAVLVSPPAVVSTYTVSPALNADVSSSYSVPNVTMLTAAFRLASASAKPNAAILLASSASAFDTSGVLPDTPDTYTASPLERASAALAAKTIAPDTSTFPSFRLMKLASTSAWVSAEPFGDVPSVCVVSLVTSATISQASPSSCPQKCGEYHQCQSSSAVR